MADNATDVNDLQRAKGVLERVAQHRDELLKTANTDSADAETTFYRLSCDYFVLRVSLAWKQQNLPIADLMWSKGADDDSAGSDSLASENLAEVAYDIGNELLTRGDCTGAVRWLQRAFDTLARVEPLYLSDNGTELRLRTAHSYGRVLPPAPCQLT
jgi:hypothetical protein